MLATFLAFLDHRNVIRLRNIMKNILDFFQNFDFSKSKKFPKKKPKFLKMSEFTKSFLAQLAVREFFPLVLLNSEPTSVSQPTCISGFWGALGAGYIPMLLAGAGLPLVR